MTDRFAGTYFDGISGRERAVELRRVGASHYAVQGDGIERGGTLDQIVITPRLARIPRTIEFTDGARLLIAHDADIDAWFPQRRGLEAWVDRLERHAYAVAVAILVCLSTMTAGAIWGVPWLADRIAEQIPPAAERALGEQVLASMDRLGLEPSVLEAERRDELTARFAKLANGLGDTPGYRLEFRHAPGIGANAFALPGGTVVVTDELVDLVSDDREFDAVVAHEIGHQQHRHTLRQTLRSSFVAIAAAFFAGDVSSASTVVIAIPTFLLDSHYSRAFEEEADRYAFELLARHEDSPHWFAEAMRTLAAEMPDDGQLAYLSSHPTSADRISAADAAASAFASTHPDLCPNGVCPGEESVDDDESDCDDCEDEDGGDPADTESPSLACDKNFEA
jgi:Zn-dependent protease with chaperone function